MTTLCQKLQFFGKHGWTVFVGEADVKTQPKSEVLHGKRQGLWMLGMGSSCWTVTSNCQLPKQLFPSLHDEFVLPPCDSYQPVKVSSGSSQISVCSHPLMKSWGWALEPENRLGRETCANHTPNSTVLKSSLFENKSIWSATCHRHSTVKRVAEGPGALGVARLSESNHCYVLNCLNLPMQKGKTRRRVCDPSWLLSTVFSCWLLCLIWLSCNLAPVQIERLLTASA